jgi:hypothetical protein
MVASPLSKVPSIGTDAFTANLIELPSLTMPIFAKRSVAIHGSVGYVQLTVVAADQDETLFGEAMERRKQLETEIKLQVRTTLGDEFEALTVNFSRGGSP